MDGPPLSTEATETAALPPQTYKYPDEHSARKGASGVPADSEGEIVVVMVAVDDKKKGMNMRSYWCFLGVFFKVQGVCDSQLEKGRGWLVA